MKTTCTKMASEHRCSVAGELLGWVVVKDPRNRGLVVDHVEVLEERGKKPESPGCLVASIATSLTIFPLLSFFSGRDNAAQRSR